MPGATTARFVVCDFEMPMKLFMMPQTVPNRPTNGDVAPMVARSPCRAERRDSERTMSAKLEATRSLMLPSISMSADSRASLSRWPAAAQHALLSRSSEQRFVEGARIPDRGKRTAQPAARERRARRTSRGTPSRSPATRRPGRPSSPEPARRPTGTSTTARVRPGAADAARLLGGWRRSRRALLPERRLALARAAGATARPASGAVCCRGGRGRRGWGGFCACAGGSADPRIASRR